MILALKALLEGFLCMLLRIKQLKIGTYGIFAFLIIALATLLRIFLIAWGWPHSNSDVDTTGIMAMHIADKGEHPIFFYGQNYQGALDAYLGVAFFRLFGISVFSLRLGAILFFALFLVIMYCLTSLLYTKKLALITLVLLSLGSSFMLDAEIAGLAGYPELLFFGSLSMLLASWLALSYDQYSSPNRRLWRSIAYGCWGLVVGLGFWSDFLMLVFILLSGLLLVLFCWRELLRFAILPLVTGLIIGSFPLIMYNLHAAPGQNTLNVLSYLHNAGSVELAKIRAHNHILLEPELKGTMLISLPAATGGAPFCYDTNLRLTGYLSFQNVQCPSLHSNVSAVFVALAWSVGFLVLWTIAVILTIHNLLKLSIQTPRPQTDKQAIIRQFARLMLLCSGGLILLLFILSPASAVFPENSRYLIGLLISTPALIAPLWDLSFGKRAMAYDGSNDKRSWFTFISFKKALGRGILLIIGIVLLVGTIQSFLEISTVQASNQKQVSLVHNLLRIQATHIYTDYWTCNSIAFASREQIICSVVDGQLHMQPHLNRYAPYSKIVKADPNSAYVFPIEAGQVPAIVERAAHSPGQFKRFVFGDYVVYQPVVPLRALQ
jgi:4-amino-4-deoxy-L-arabinose transferase-like glycosyltransferase